MIVRPCSLLLGLLVILYLQSCAVGQNGKAPEQCCFRFYTRPIHASHITEYEESDPHCPKVEIVFTTKNGVRVCVDPRFKWVQRAMDIIDRRIVEGSNSTQLGD